MHKSISFCAALLVVVLPIIPATSDPNHQHQGNAYAIIAKESEDQSKIANLKFDQKDWDGAIKSYSSLIKSRQGNSFKNYLMRGRSFFEKKMYQKAYNDLESALELAPKELNKESITFEDYSEVFYWKMQVYSVGADAKINRDVFCHDFFFSLYYKNKKTMALLGNQGIKRMCRDYLPELNAKLSSQGVRFADPWK